MQHLRGGPADAGGSESIHSRRVERSAASGGASPESSTARSCCAPRVASRTAASRSACETSAVAPESFSRCASWAGFVVGWITGTRLPLEHEDRDRGFCPIVEIDDHAIAPRDAGFDQAVGERVRAILEFGVGESLLAADQRDLLRSPFRAALEKALQLHAYPVARRRACLRSMNATRLRIESRFSGTSSSSSTSIPNSASR